MSVATGHFDDDGKLDMAVANSGVHFVSVRMGNGDGTFSNGPNIYIGGTGPKALCVTAVDFDADGDSDLAIGIGDDQDDDVGLQLWRCNGNGQFTKVNSAKTDSHVRPDGIYIVSDYFNDDDKLDIAVAIDNYASLWILLQNLDGTFPSTPTVVSTSGGPGYHAHPSCIGVADFDDDADVDLAVANAGSTVVASTVAILENDGDGSFSRVDEIIQGWADAK